MNATKELLAEQMTQTEYKPSDLDIPAEAEHLQNVLSTELQEILTQYYDPKVEGIGGSGIVISATFTPFESRRALKFPRQRLYAMSRDDEDAPPDTDPEIHALSKLSHKHITRLYSAHRLSVGSGICTITEYVSSPAALNHYAKAICCSEECRRDDQVLTHSLAVLSRLIYDLADAIGYMHSQAGLYHFDIKPDNLLVSKEGWPFVTDLGFARDVSKYGEEDKVQVGFTWKYAHPRLTDPHAGARVSSTALKSKNTLTAAQLSPVFDMFAFGRSIQEILKVLEDEHGEHIHTFYAFNYLHVVAGLCLDGHNARNHHMSATRTFVSDQPMGLPLQVLEKHRLGTFDDVKYALEALLGLHRIEDEVPELDRWSSRTINVSDLGISVLTERVSRVITHPVVDRLSKNSQLGMLDTIYPTATHTRLQHTLGVYHAVADYLRALYYDPESPTFRVLVRAGDIRKCLLAALLHDVGQSTFGHEMEEIDKEKFSHAKLAQLLLKSSTLTDSEGNALRELIEGDTPHCWNMAISDVLGLLSGAYNMPLDEVLHGIIDSQIDADKLDYLVRDSVECRVPYGHGIDVSRFVRSLTTTGVGTGANARLRLAIKRKGAASAEAFAFARYQMYQSVYWHHTFRAVKGMLLTAAGNIFSYPVDELPADGAEDVEQPNKQQPLAIKSTLRDEPRICDSFVKFILDERPEPDNSGKKRKTQGVKGPWWYEKLWNDLDEPAPTSKYAKDATVRFLWKLAARRKDRALLNDLLRRRYYKRIFEMPISSISEAGWLSIRDKFRGPERVKLQLLIETEFTRFLRTAIQDESAERQSLVADDTLAEFSRIADEKHCFLVDLPARGWTAEGDAPSFVSDFKRRHFRIRGGTSKGAKDADLWTDEMPRMMRRIAFVRVFCEPDVHRIVTRVVHSDDIETLLTTLIPELSQ